MKTVKIRNLTVGKGCPKICVPIVGNTLEEVSAATEHIGNLPVQPDLVEIRMDWFEHVFCWEKVRELLENIRMILSDMPLLFTFRTAKEGGECDITYQQYESLLLDAACSGLIDAIDVEAFSFEKPMDDLIQSIRKKDVVVIGSNHDFQKTPECNEIVRRLCMMQDMGVDIAKIAVMPNCTEDVLTLLRATAIVGEDDTMCPVITMSMSGKGSISRLAGEVFHSAVTFASAGKASAPGQIPVEQLEQVLKIIHSSL